MDFGPITRTLDYPEAGMKVHWKSRDGVLCAEYHGEVPDERLPEGVRDFGAAMAETLYEAIKTRARGMVADITDFRWKLRMDAEGLNESVAQATRDSRIPIAVIVRDAPEQADHTRILCEGWATVFVDKEPGLSDWLHDPVHPDG